LKIFQDDLGVSAVAEASAAGQQLRHACLQRLGAEGDAGERIIDFVSNTGRKKTNTGQPFGANQLPTAFVDLLGQVAIQLVEASGHVVEGRGQSCISSPLLTLMR